MKMKTLFTRAAAIALLALTFLAPARNASATSVSGTFTLVSSTGPLLYAHNGAKFTASISGTFVGKVALLRSLDGVNFASDPSALVFVDSFTVTTKTIQVQTPAAQNAWYRLDMTAWTSGSVTTTLADFNNLVRSAPNTFGVSVEDQYDNGIDLPSGSQLGVANTVILGEPLRPYQRTKAQLQALTPLHVGDCYQCSDCTNKYTIVCATATASADQFLEVGTSTGVQ